MNLLLGTALNLLEGFKNCVLAFSQVHTEPSPELILAMFLESLLILTFTLEVLIRSHDFA